MKIEGKRVLITGGSTGIGFALVKALLSRSAKVVITGRRPDALATRLGAPAHPCPHRLSRRNRYANDEVEPGRGSVSHASPPRWSPTPSSKAWKRTASK